MAANNTQGGNTLDIFSMFKIGYVDFRALFDRESDQNEEYCFQKMR